MGKSKRLNFDVEYPKVSITSNVVDRSSIKSFYLLISGYFDLTYDELIEYRVKLSKTIKKNLNKELFHTDRVIGVEEIRTYNNFNYVCYEFTIFLLKENIITINELEVETKKLTDLIYEIHFDKPEFKIK